MIKRLFETDKKLVIRFAVSLFLTIFLAVFFFTCSSYAAGVSDVTGTNTGEYLDTEPQYTGDSPTSSVLQEVIGVDASQPLEVILLLTLFPIKAAYSAVFKNHRQSV